MQPAAKTIFLFSIDLEDVRLNVKNGLSYKERVPVNTEAYLTWLQKRKAHCTFFTTGQVAEMYPSLIQQIISEGHEIACHSHWHQPITQQTPQQFRADLEENMSALTKAGASNIYGYRAPTFSLTPKTAWAFDILKELGFVYSSSVLPAKNPLYGWDSFGATPRKVNEQVLEIPITVGRVGLMTVPAFGGIYFRLLPLPLIKTKLRQLRKSGLPLIGYFHPYDVDTQQERFMHGGINNNRFYNRLMYVNRNKVFSKLDALAAQDLHICTYHTYVNSL